AAPPRASRLRPGLAGRERSGAGRSRGARAATCRSASPERLRGERPPAGRDRERRLGSPRRRVRSRLPARAEAMTSELIYGRRPVRELVRGPREVLELWATERALRAEPWLEDAPVRVQRKPERELNAAAGTTDHQGVLARAEPYRYADAYQLADGP